MYAPDVGKAIREMLQNDLPYREAESAGSPAGVQPFIHGDGPGVPGPTDKGKLIEGNPGNMGHHPYLYLVVDKLRTLLDMQLKVAGNVFRIALGGRYLFFNDPGPPDAIFQSLATAAWMGQVSGRQQSG